VVIIISWNCQRAYWCKDKKVLGRLWKGLFRGGKKKPNRRRIEGKKEGKKNKYECKEKIRGNEK